MQGLDISSHQGSAYGGMDPLPDLGPGLDPSFDHLPGMPASDNHMSAWFDTDLWTNCQKQIPQSKKKPFVWRKALGSCWVVCVFQSCVTHQRKSNMESWIFGHITPVLFYTWSSQQTSPSDLWTAFSGWNLQNAGTQYAYHFIPVSFYNAFILKWTKYEIHDIFVYTTDILVCTPGLYCWMGVADIEWRGS